MEELVKEYLRILQCIAISKGGDEFAPTIPSFNTRRMDVHDRLFDEIKGRLNFAEHFTENDAYWRSKEIFSRLDKVFRLYNDFDLDLTNTEHIIILSKDLYKFLCNTTVSYYLEGRTNQIPRVIETD